MPQTLGDQSISRAAAPGREEATQAMSFNPQKMLLQMQRDMQRVEEELQAARVEGTAGGGVVRVVATGKRELVSIVIDPAAVDPEDVEMLQDLILAAVTEALNASRDLEAAKMAAITGGLRLPGM
jgi:nucleoid-associated protein EbfC